MNQAFELVEETVSEETVLPEVVEAIDPHKHELERLREQANGLEVVDEITEQAALLFISTCKSGFSTMEDGRKALVKPKNDYVDRVNDAFRPYTTLYKELGKAVDERRSSYLTKKQQVIEEANRRAIADAEQKRREQFEKEEAARKEAERLRFEAERIEQEERDRIAQAERDRLAAEKKIRDEKQAVLDAKRKGDAEAARAAQALVDKTKRDEEERAAKAETDRLAAIEEQSGLEKKAIQQDTKADIAASKGQMTTPQIAEESIQKGVQTLDNGLKVGTRKAVDWRFTNGMPKDGDYYQDDARVKGIPARYFILDTSKLGKDVKNGVPVEGTLRTEGFSTTGRK